MPDPSEFSGSTKKQFVVVSNRSIGFSIAATVASATVVQLLSSIIRIPRLGSVRPTELDITYGVTDDPIDERIEVYLADGDPTSLPDQSALNQRSLWQTAQNWRVIVGGDGTIQTFSRENVDFFTETSYVQRAAEFHAERNLMFMIVSTAQSAVFIKGVIFWVETLVQRVWGDDNAFSDIMKEEMWEDTEDG